MTLDPRNLKELKIELEVRDGGPNNIVKLSFGGGQHAIGKLTLFDSYHCSRYNTNTRVLTPEMFREVFAAVRAYLGNDSHATTSSALLSGGNTG